MAGSSLLEALNALDHFREQSAAILDRLESAANGESTRLASIEERLRNCTAKIESLRGSTRPLTIRSASTLTAKTAETVDTFERITEPSALNSLGYAVNMPEESLPSFAEAADDLARTAKYFNAQVTRPVPDRKGPRPTHLSSVSDLILFNSDMKPYENYRHVDNLRAVLDAQKDAAEMNAPWRRPDVPAPNLLEDLPEAAPEDIRFVPVKPDQVTFDLPDVLPDLGRVADLTWRQEDTQASEPIAWDAWAAPAALPTVDIPAPKPALADQPFQKPTQQSFSPPQRPPAPAAPSEAKPAAPQPPQGPPAPATPTPPATEAGKGKGKAPPPPPAAAAAPKGKGKGPGKGPPSPKKAPPPPAKGKGKGPPPKKETGAPGASKPAPDVGALLASIRKGTTLKKMSGPKSKHF